MTVIELENWLSNFPPDSKVRGYEGENGAWIVVDLPDGTEQCINTDDEEGV